MKNEIKGLFRFQSGNYMPCGINIWQQLWWRFMPGVIVRVRWPCGEIIVNQEDPRWRDVGGAVWVNLGFSADPNDHYRWYLERYVGRQGWDWNWGLAHNDIAENTLTIKIRRNKSRYATIMAVRWS